MKLEIVRIADRGSIGQERLHLSVKKDANLSSFVVLLSRLVTAGVVNGSLQSFWFPVQAVKPGDTVVLFGTAGTAASRKEENGSTTYFYYWGLPAAVWRDPNSCVVLVEAGNWDTSAIGG